MLGNNVYTKHILSTNNLYGVFINDVDKVHMYDCIILTYNYSENFSYILDSLLIDHPEYVGSYFPSTNKINYIFNIPEEYKEDYYNILNGDYSKLSKEYIDNTISFWIDESTDTKKNIIYNIFVYNENLKEIYKQYKRNKEEHEIWFKPILESELFDIVEAK
jgi:hypothetical protein